MGVWARAGREVKFLLRLKRVLKRIKSVDPNAVQLVCDDFEAAVDKWPEHVAIVFEDRQVTYRELDAMANRFAHWVKGRGLKRGDTVALFMPNRIEYVAIWMGFAKAGVATALINTNLIGAALAHSISVSAASHVIADLSTIEAAEAVRHDVPRSLMMWVLGLNAEDETSERRGLDTAIRGASSVRPSRASREGLTGRDTVLYIYTSGTTGMPKAARIPHTRAQLYMQALAAATEATDKDRVYCVLPLYHSTGGLCGVGAALMNGGTLVLRRRFSASEFWKDVVEKQCTLFVYIGELCRYLINQESSEIETKHKLKMVFGNGLRPEVWGVLQSRFRIPEVLEFYGSTEGNVSLFNFDGRPGAIGRVPGYLRKEFDVRLVRYDPEAGDVVRGTNGFCFEARTGEVGEALGKIKDDARHSYSGYADKAASDRKVLRDVFERGDAWFRTGDLMRQDSDGYFYFIDRVGDTFRWKGENVSTTEVAERLATAPGVLEATVYGVPVGGAEGKAGMAALVVGPDFDLAKMSEYLELDLPSYARPLFVRLLKDLSTTGTFKYRKTDLEAEGFDTRRTRDPIWFNDPKTGWVKVTARLRDRLMSGDAGI